jgi:hypothetical protein
MAVAPSSMASSDARAPPIFPKGVRAEERITEFDIRAFLLFSSEETAGRHRES